MINELGRNSVRAYVAAKGGLKMLTQNRVTIGNPSNEI